MRVAISDFPGDTALDGIGVPQGAHWSVRLATKLLLERSQGTASPWYPYLEARSQGHIKPHLNLDTLVSRTPAVNDSAFAAHIRALVNHRSSPDSKVCTQALPEAVWTPLRLLEDGQLAQLQYQPMVRAVHSQQALIDDAAEACEPRR